MRKEENPASVRIGAGWGRWCGGMQQVSEIVSVQHKIGQEIGVLIDGMAAPRAFPQIADGRGPRIGEPMFLADICYLHKVGVLAPIGPDRRALTGDIAADLISKQGEREFQSKAILWVTSR